MNYFAETTTYMNRNYLELAKICKAVYPGPIDHRKLRYNGISMDHQKIVHGSVGRGFCRIFWNSETVVFAFRGTREIFDWWISNIKMMPRALKNCGEGAKEVKVHSGFQKALYYPDKTTKSDAFDAIILHVKQNELFDGNRKIVITGHSLGGAIGTLFAAKLRYLYPNYVKDHLINIVVFGSPSVGLKKFHLFYDSLHERTVRIVNGSDGVPFAPPAFYYHVGSELWLDINDIKTNQKWKMRFLRAIRLPIGKFLRDHKIKSYINRLKLEFTDNE